MVETKEIAALFTLIDDPDEDVYGTVSNRIIDYGKAIIPNLEHLWEITPNTQIQERIEMLIHRLHYTDLTQDLTEWSKSTIPDLLFGAILVAKFQYPDLHTTPILQDIEKIRRNIWLELNSFLTPLEQANVLSSIIFNYYNLKGGDNNYEQVDEFLINKVLETKKGNVVSNAIIYQIMCNLLEIKASIIHVPQQMLIAFFAPDYDAAKHQANPQEKILFFVDSLNGQAYGHQEVESYFKRISVPPTPAYFKPMSSKRMIQMLIEEVSKCFAADHLAYKQQELLALSEILND